MAIYNKQIIQKITRGLGSKYPLFYILGWEEERMQRLLSVIAESAFPKPVPLVSWTSSQGFSNSKNAKVTDPVLALQHILQSDARCLYLMKDLPAEFEQNPALIRAARDLYYQIKNKGIFVFFTHPLLKLPDVLKKEVFLIEMPLPTEEEILDKMNFLLEMMDESVRPEAELLHRMAVGMKGLSLDEVEHLQARLLKRQDLDMGTAMVEIQDEKAQILRKESCLRFYPPQASLNDVGGLDNLKGWVLKRGDLFTESAFKAGIPLPSGILFVGVSGCGKSMAAKAIAAAWQLPLVRMDMSLILSGSYGSPEYAFEHATRIAEEIAPIVMWIDELENAFGYDNSVGSSGNVNIFSSFLTWMQEKPSSVFLAATANRIQQLPAELMRKGRFDQLFFLDLPTKEERMQIFSIHIALNGGDSSRFDVSYMAAATRDWSGAEIEQAIKSARVDAYQEDRPFDEKDVLRNCINMVPLSKTMGEQIEAIKDWSFNRAVPASKPAPES
jgi:SpoVK/Ycf46/Vps4 family AAA+-type ATPase